MLQSNLHALDILSTPVWIITPRDQEIIFANRAAKDLSDSVQLHQLRNGPLSAHAQPHLEAYLPALSANEQVIEIWTITKEGNAVPMSCRLSLVEIETKEFAIVVEGQCTFDLVPARTSVNMGQQRTTQRSADERMFYEQLFSTNTAPMLLIDPSENGQIVYANLAATHFYGYSRDEMCKMHTWEINAMGKNVLPVMQEIAKLPGGHKPLNFIHKLADGTTRHVQTYAGAVELDDKRLMLCMVHDITEQKRLEHELERAASRDPLTGLWNRRQFPRLVERAQSQSQRYTQTYSLMLVDVDNFKVVNDNFGHQAGDEFLIFLAHTLEARVRENDVVCRWGGEEFLVLLPQTKLEGALHLAESIRETVEKASHPNLPRLTVSIGVSQHQADEDTATLFKRADEALYRAKAAGRNRVMSA